MCSYEKELGNDEDDVSEVKNQDSNSEQSEGEELLEINEPQQVLNARLCCL